MLAFHPISVKRVAVAIATSVVSVITSATITPVSMDMKATASSCLTGCTSHGAYVTDTDSAGSPTGSFSDLSVASAVYDGGNSFDASAYGTTTIDSDTQFTARLHTMRPYLNASEGIYDIGASTKFSFLTDANGGTLTIAYEVSYNRPVHGVSLDAGIGFVTPVELKLFGGHSVNALSMDSLSGTVSGSWVYQLDPNTYYNASLDVHNGVGYTNSVHGFDADMLDAVYVVTLPSFAAPVPEPGTTAMLLLGGALVTAVALRRRRVQPVA